MNKPWELELAVRILVASDVKKAVTLKDHSTSLHNTVRWSVQNRLVRRPRFSHTGQIKPSLVDGLPHSLEEDVW